MEIVTLIAFFVVPSFAFLITHYLPYLNPRTLDKEADIFVNTAIDLGMVRYDEFNAYIEGWGSIWVTNHPYGSGGIYKFNSNLIYAVRGTYSRVRLKTTRRLRKDRRLRGLDM